MKQTYYLYRITNLTNGKYYLGKRAYNGENPHDDINYLGSGRLIKLAVVKYGRDNFKKEILSIHCSLKELSDAERTLITENEVKDKTCYNTTLGGHGGNLGEFAMAKLRKTMQTPEYKQKMSAAINAPAVKQKISASIKKTMSDPVWKEKFSKIQKEAQGRPEERLRNSIKQKEAQNRPEVAEAKSRRMLAAFSRESTKRKHKEACNTPEIKAARSELKKDTIWINNGTKQKYVKPPFLQEHLDTGWVLGMLKRK